MNRVIKTSIRKTITAVRTAKKYKDLFAKDNVQVPDLSGITVVFTGHSMKVGGSGKVFDDFIETGKIVWPKEFHVIRFDEMFTHGNNSPENGTCLILYFNSYNKADSNVSVSNVLLPILQQTILMILMKTTQREDMVNFVSNT